MVRDTIQLENAVSTISQEYLLEFTFEYGIPESLHPELPQRNPSWSFQRVKSVFTPSFSNLQTINWNNRFFWVDEKIFPTVVEWRTNAPKDEMPSADMDLFSFISASNPAKVKIGTRPRAAHEVLLLTATASRAAREEMRERVLRKDYAASRPTQSTREERSIVPMRLDAGFVFSMSTAQDAPAAAKSILQETTTEVPTGHVATTEVQGGISAESPKSGKSTPFLSVDGSPEGIYQPGWGVTNNCRLDTPDACQDMVDHVLPPGYFSELRHLPNTDFLSHYNMNLARQVAMCSQLRLRFEQEVRLLKKATTRIAKRDQRIKFADLQVSNSQLSQQVSTLRAQVPGEERIKAAFEEFKKYEDDRVNYRCAEMDARLDALSIDFDEELYPHMLTAIAGRQWVIGHGLRLVVMKYLADIEAYDPEADAKYVAALHALKDLKYPLVDQLKKLKDAPIDLIMASLYLESDSGEDAPQFICELRPSSSQLKIHVVRDHKDPWSSKEEILLEDAIAANISRAEKKKKCRVMCRTHGVGSAHHARSDGFPVSVPTVAPQGLAILLTDAST
uniref:Transposase (Putative), gypsy type n=1 Tax=Tanacetum cinerariifolium TaxID=118510 RepID=A0A6L2JRQ5_TANCI|nr:hypothetical protein [Tanacetum cinerariifolium]